MGRPQLLNPAAVRLVLIGKPASAAGMTTLLVALPVLVSAPVPVEERVAFADISQHHQAHPGAGGSLVDGIDEETLRTVKRGGARTIHEMPIGVLTSMSRLVVGSKEPAKLLALSAV